MSLTTPTGTLPNDTIPTSQSQPQPSFPNHTIPSRTWLITTAATPLCTSLIPQLLNHGDNVVACISPHEHSILTSSSPFPSSPSPTPLSSLDDLHTLSSFLRSSPSTPPLPHDASQSRGGRFAIKPLDARSVSSCQTLIAEIIAEYKHVDILLCSADNLITVGSVEEFSPPGVSTDENDTKRKEKQGNDTKRHDRQGNILVRDSFEANFFSHVNCIQALVPHFRQRRNGHFVVLTGTTGHLGTPGLGIYCASQWAMEGYCDTLTYEVAPFNIKTTIVQPNIEVGVLTNKIVCAGKMDEYARDKTRAPLFRDVLSGLLDKIEDDYDDDQDDDGEERQEKDDGFIKASIMLQSKLNTTVLPNLNSHFKTQLVEETVHAIIAIGGHENPPSRHIVGHEAVASVKEKLKTVSQELEDYCEASAAADCMNIKDCINIKEDVH